MEWSASYVLVINAGSSSIKISCYQTDNFHQQFSGEIKNIGDPKNCLMIKTEEGEQSHDMDTSDNERTIRSLTDWFERQPWFDSIIGIGHRIVHGMKHTRPQLISDNLLTELNDIIEFDPDHLKLELGIIKSFQKRFRRKPQIACFDTSFHTTMPDVAAAFAIPIKYFKNGIKRYGFHGISYAYLMQALKNRKPAMDTSRVILAHLGNGASVAAVRDGHSIDTSMGFTPAAGIVMSTRSGDLDPGVAWYLMKQGMDAREFNQLINKESGLLGLSEKSGDMKYLLDHRDENPNYQLAIDIFCYRLQKCIGAYMAALGGLDALIFSGGIGEHSPEVRKKVCSNLAYAGIEIDDHKNESGKELISKTENRVKVLVIPTDEEIMIARETMKILKNDK